MADVSEVERLQRRNETLARQLEQALQARDAFADELARTGGERQWGTWQPGEANSVIDWKNDEVGARRQAEIADRQVIYRYVTDWRPA